MHVLVLFHIYYFQEADYYLQKLRNIHSCSWDLVVTGGPFPEDLTERLRQANPGVRFVRTENLGYDIWPFIVGVKSVDLNDYDFVIKLHTKNSDDYPMVLNGIKMNCREWKELMVDAMLGSPERFSRLMRIFSSPKSGIAFNRQLGFRSKGANPEDCELLDGELKRLGIRKRRTWFCAGTMFAARAGALAFLQDSRVHSDSFQQTGHSHESGTMAHVYERLIPIAVQSQRLRYVPLYDNARAVRKFFVKDALEPTLEWIFSINEYRGKGTKRITVFGFNFYKQVKH